jgi:hypothetical protein
MSERTCISARTAFAVPILPPRCSSTTMRAVYITTTISGWKAWHPVHQLDSTCTTAPVTPAPRERRDNTDLYLTFVVS